jgi:hypothetical protein
VPQGVGVRVPSPALEEMAALQ